jgi:hypothetical protein
MYIRRTAWTLLIAMAFALVAGCGGPGGSGLTVDPESVLLVVGETHELKASRSGGAQGTIEWSTADPSVATVSGDGVVSAVAQGETTVTASLASDPAVSDEVAIVVTPPGAVRWTRQLGSATFDTAEAVAVDASNAVLVAGDTSGALGDEHIGSTDVYLRKLNAEGEEAWTRQVGTTGQDGVGSNGVAVGPSGTVVVAGQIRDDEEGGSGGTDVLLRAFRSDGEPAWTRDFGTSGYEGAEAVAAASDGRIVVAGYTNGDLAAPAQGVDDAFVRVWTPDGAVAWTDQFGTPEYEEIRDVAVDASGAVVVVGHSTGDLVGPSAGNYDVFVRKYRADGDVAWTHVLGSAASEYASGIAIAAGGDVVATASTDGVLGAASVGNSDVVVQRLRSDGSPVWTRQFGTPAFDASAGVAVSSADDIIVAGVTRGSIEGSSAGDDDGFVRKSSPTGAEVWTRQFGTPAEDDPWGVAVDGRGETVVVGQTRGVLADSGHGGVDAFVRKYGR